MGFQTRILLSMLLVIVLALAGTMYVAWDFAGDQEEAYNARRLVRKEASVERSLNYTLDRLPDSLGTEDIPKAFTKPGPPVILPREYEHTRRLSSTPASAREQQRGQEDYNRVTEL